MSGPIFLFVSCNVISTAASLFLIENVRIVVLNTNESWIFNIYANFLEINWRQWTTLDWRRWNVGISCMWRYFGCFFIVTSLHEFQMHLNGLVVLCMNRIGTIIPWQCNSVWDWSYDAHSDRSNSMDWISLNVIWRHLCRYENCYWPEMIENSFIYIFLFLDSAIGAILLFNASEYEVKRQFLKDF